MKHTGIWFLILSAFSVSAGAVWETAATLRREERFPEARQLLKEYSSPANFETLKSAEKIEFLRGLLELAHLRALQDDDWDGESDLADANADSSKKYHPIAYQSTAVMSATAIFKPNCRNSNDTDFISAYDVEAAVKKVRFTPYSFGSSNNWSTPTDLNMSGTAVTAASAFHSSAQVGYHGSFELAWEVGFGESGTSDDALSWERSCSEHELYLTCNAAIPSYETVFHIGCTNADGQSSEKQIVASIWREFSDCSVKRKGRSNSMKYWGPVTAVSGNHPEFFTTSGLLNNEDGRCGAWQDFIIKIAAAQGINISAIHLFETNTTFTNRRTAFLIKNYSFNGSGSSGNALYPYLWSEINDLPGIAAQGNSNPRSIFVDHAIVLYDATYYDPSYGVSASNLTSYRNSAIAGWLDVGTSCVTSDISLHALVSK